MKTKKCLCCDKQFIPEHKNSKYCANCSKPIIHCAECGKEFILKESHALAKFHKQHGEGNYFCSCSCANKNTFIKNKKEKSYKSKTGYSNPSQNPEVKNKKKRNYKSKTGYNCPLNNPKVLNKIKETNYKKYGFDYPSQAKCVKEKRIETCKKKFGAENVFMAEEIKNKSAETKYKKYGDPKFVNVDKAKQTYKKETGYNNPSQNPEVKKKKADTYKKHYGVDNPSKANKVKNKRKITNVRKFGVECTLQNEEIHKKSLATRKQNNNVPKTELFFIQKLEEAGYELGKDFIHEYKSEEYPFYCDFYFPTNNLYIELNIHFTHGGHWFDKENKDDQNKLKYWQQKVANSKFYKNAIWTWTKRDVEKRKIAKQNNLNYAVLWNDKEIKEWLNNFLKNFKKI